MSKKQLGRGVSIIGVGITQFGDADDPATPQLKDMSLQDMAAWACLEAMEDAGVNPRQIDKLVVGMVCATSHNSENIAPNHGFLEFIGMKGKAAVHQSEACATPYDCLNEAILSIASGRYDICIAVDSDATRHIQAPDQPSHMRYPSNLYKELYGRDWAGGATCLDTAYARWHGATYTHFDVNSRCYLRENGITPEQLDDAVNGQAITAARHGSLNPKAYRRTPWEDIAKQRDFDDVKEYMKSRYVPKLSEYMRASTFAMLSEGAAALIVCATEIADQFKQKPIEIVNFAQYDLGMLTPNATPEMTRGVIKQIYEVTGYKPEDIEYFQTMDGDLADALDSAEVAGYLPKGEGWKYFRDGRTSFAGDKPMCTDGGHQCLGHAFGATGMATIGECVIQMRGQAGARQIPKPPKVSLMRGWGAGQSESAYIFTTSNIEPKNPNIEAPHYDPKPLVKMFYDALDRGIFLGMKCPKCGNVEFPPYPTCNRCGNYDNELTELSGDVTIDEVYEAGAPFITPEFAKYGQLYGCDFTLKEGAKTIGLIFGVKKETYPEIRDNLLPLDGKLVTLKRNGYNTWAISINGALPVEGEAVSTEGFEKLRTGHLVEKD